MGIFTRADSPWFWIYLEPIADCAAEKIRTPIRCDGPSAEQRKINRELADQLYHRKMADRARGIVAPEAKPARTFKEQADWFTRHVLPRRKGNEREATTLPKLTAVFGAMPLRTLTRAVVTQHWITPRLAKNTPRTVNREVSVIKAVLQSAVPDYLESSPLYGMPLLKGATPKRRLLTADEEKKLLKVMRPDDKALFLIALDSLVRMGDVLDLRFEDDHGAHVWIGDPKSGDGFAVPISTRTREALDTWLADPKCPKRTSLYLFARRRRAKTARDRRGVIRKMLKGYCAKTDPPIPYGRKVGGITFHWATRRTGATRMLTRKVDLGTVQKVGGWKTASVVLGIYHELIDDKARAAVEAVNEREPGGNREGETTPPDPEATPPGTVPTVGLSKEIH